MSTALLESNPSIRRNRIPLAPHELEERFESAVGKLWVAYQPIIRWSTHAVFAHEALVRSREAGMTHPGALFDAADRLGQVRRLGRLVRSAAPAVMDRTNALLFVNVTAHDLEDDDLFAPESPLAVLARRTVLEVTERVSIDGVADVHDRIAALRRMGFRIALDDVGAGYSGLCSFAVLEPDVVKLDMSLVRGVEASNTKQRIVRSMLALCEGLDRVVVAEGVETLNEWRTLVDLGCDYFQGFLFARPALAFPQISWGPATDMASSVRILRAGPS